MILPGLRLLLVSLLLAGCGASTQKPAIETAMDNDALRKESFEATLRVLDEHPEYVDELFQATRKHPKTLDRFVSNVSKGLAEDDLARLTARRLAEHPDSLRMVMIANLDEISDDPAALDAVSSAMEERPQIAAIAIVQREQALRATLKALLGEVRKNAAARRAFLIAIQENSAAMADLIARNPNVMASMLRAFAKIGVSHGKEELEALVKALGND